MAFYLFGKCGPLISFRRQSIELASANFDQGKLGGDEERVE